MIVAVDSSVIFSVLKGEGDAARWMDLLVKYAASGELCISEVVAAEVGAHFSSEVLFKETLENLNICLVNTSIEACYLAGKVFSDYRKEGGPREHLIPDFLVAAHAFKQANLLLAKDRGYCKRYFPELKVIDSA